MNTHQDAAVKRLRKLGYSAAVLGETRQGTLHVEVKRRLRRGALLLQVDPTGEWRGDLMAYSSQRSN